MLFSPSLGLELVEAARRSYKNQTDLLRGYRLIAHCALADVGAFGRTILGRGEWVVVRQDALSVEPRKAVAELKSKGVVYTYRHLSGEDVIVPTIPAAFLSELEDAAGSELDRRSEIVQKKLALG